MSLIKWEPFDEFDRVFRDLQPFSALRSQPLGWDLAADVYEDGETLVAEMNLPGLSADDIDVEVEAGHLRVAGKREEVDEKRGKSHYAKEIRRGSFERVIPLPDVVREDGVEATYRDGVLTVVMQKRAQDANKRIKVKVS